jgi:acyl-CoA thioester hydrolase
VPRFRHRIRVRYSECDLQGVVFNANYLTYLDEAMTELWRAEVEGGYGAMVEAGVDMVVAEARIRYLSPARFDDEIDVEARVTRLGTTGLTTALQVLRGEQLLAEAELRHVFVHAGEGGKTPIPDEVRSALSRYEEAAVA